MERYEKIARDNGKILLKLLEYNTNNYWKSKIISVHVLCGKETEETLFNTICKYSCPYCKDKLKASGKVNRTVLNVQELLRETDNEILKGLEHNLKYLEGFIYDDKLIEHLIPLILEFKSKK